jgi:Leucine-rich repeat (LRR) protein
LDDIEFKKFTPEIKEKIEKLAHIESITANNCRLETLKNFPNCANLSRVEIGENDFPASELVHLTSLKGLESLDLHECNIETIEDLSPLKEIPNLMELDISMTNLAKGESFRDKIFKMLKKLVVLNGADKDGNPVEESDDDEEEYDEDEEDNDG